MRHEPLLNIQYIYISVLIKKKKCLIHLRRLYDILLTTEMPNHRWEILTDAYIRIHRFYYFHNNNNNNNNAILT